MTELKVVGEEVPRFRFDLPFRTRCGWPARVLGLLRRRSGAFVVAVWNPNYSSEELHAYDVDGLQVTGLKTASEGDRPLDLVNTSDDEYYGTKSSDLVHAFVTQETSYPPNSNPFHHDLFRMGTDLAHGWIVMHESSDPMRYFQFVNRVSGQRFTVRLTPLQPMEVEARREADNHAKHERWKAQGHDDEGVPYPTYVKRVKKPRKEAADDGANTA